MKSLSKNNKSGYVGVCYDATLQRYKAYYNIGGDKFQIGYYRTPGDARAKREEVRSRVEGAEFPVVGYVQLRFPGVDEETAKEMIAGAMLRYVERTTDKMFFSFCKEFIKDNKGISCPRYEEIFHRVSVTPLAAKVFFNGQSLSSVRKTNHIQFTTLSQLLRQVVVGE